MQENNISAASQLARFEEDNNHRGLLRRYAYGRVRNFRQRQVLTLVGAVFLYFLMGPLVGILTFALAILGEAIDCIFLSHLLKKTKPDTPIKNWEKGAVTTAILQAASISGCIAITWQTGGENTRFFAMVFIAGAMLNAGLVLFYNKPASMARLRIYGLLAVSMLVLDAANGGWLDRRFWFDAFSSTLLIYLIILFIKFTHGYQQRRQRFEHAIILERRQTEIANETLRKKQRHFRWLAAVAESANDSVIISNTDNRIEWVNDTFTKTTGYSFTEAIGRIPGELLNGPETSKSANSKIIDAINKLEPVRTEIVNYTKSGQKIWVETSISPIFDDTGELTMFVGIERDISLIKQREVDLALARSEAEQAAAAKSAFLATMSHEIRTPMNGVIGMADLLVKSKLDEEQLELTKTIIEPGESLPHIINDILDFSKLGSGKLELSPQAISVPDVISRAIETLRAVARNKDIALSMTSVQSDIGFLLIDPVRLRQIVLNLVGNAIKFTDTGGVTIDVLMQEVSNNVEVTINISDTGIGIPADALHRIFENFTQADGDTTRKYGGTGLGLSISKRLAKQMGGDIVVTSTVGEGSCFQVKLFGDKAHQSHISKLTKTDNPDVENNEALIAGKRVLIAEDNRTNRLLLRKMFKRISVSLSFANDGNEAVDQFKSFRPDIVLMDVSMPIKNGLEAAKEIRTFEHAKGWPETPILALTANAFAEDQNKCINAGMNSFLSKPIKQDILIREMGIAIAVKNSTTTEIQNQKIA